MLHCTKISRRSLVFTLKRTLDYYTKRVYHGRPVAIVPGLRRQIRILSIRTRSVFKHARPLRALVPLFLPKKTIEISPVSPHI